MYFDECSFGLMNGRVILVPCDVIIAMCDVTVGFDVDDCHDDDRDAEQDTSKDKLHLHILAPVSETKNKYSNCDLFSV